MKTSPHLSNVYPPDKLSQNLGVMKGRSANVREPLYTIPQSNFEEDPTPAFFSSPDTPQNINQPTNDEEDELPMGFDAQYERMVKKQLGGMITDYLRHLNGEQVDKNKQNDNMIETLKEFHRLKPKNKNTFKVLSVEEMPKVA